MKKLLTLTLATVILAAFSGLGIAKKDAIEKAVAIDTSEAAPSADAAQKRGIFNLKGDCTAVYHLSNSSGATVATKNLGQVKWPHRQGSCLELAQNACSSIRVPVSALGLTPQQVCNQYKTAQPTVNLYIDTTVTRNGDAKRDRDGNCNAPIDITCHSNCTWTP